MTRVLVQSLVIEPIWKTESGVASTPVARLRTPAASSTTSPPARTATAAAGTSYFSISLGSSSAIQVFTSRRVLMVANVRTHRRRLFVVFDKRGEACPSARTKPVLVDAGGPVIAPHNR